MAVTPEELRNEIHLRLTLWLPKARVERVENAPNIWVYLPNGQCFRVLIEERSSA